MADCGAKVFFKNGLPQYVNAFGTCVPLTFSQYGGGGINITRGATMDGGSGTPNRVVKFITATTIGDSLGYDNGVSVGYGTATPSASALIDLTSTTQGFLTPRMTTVKRDAIVAPATGLFIYNTTTNLFNYWNGVAWIMLDAGTNDWTQGGNTFGATGVLGTLDAFGVNFITNNIVAASINTSQQFILGSAAVTNGSLVFQNSTNAFTVTVNSGVTSASYAVTLPTAQGAANSFLMNDGAGVLSWNTGSGIFFMQGGNTFGATARLGTNDAFALEFETNNTLAGTISTSQLWSIGGAAPIAGVRMLITGTTNDSTTYALRVDSSVTNNNFVLRNDGNVGIRTSAPTGRLTIFSSNNNHISLSIDGGLADRYLLYLDSATEDAHYQLNNANHLFYAGGGAAQLILTVGGAGVTNGRVSIAPSTSADYQDWKFYVETSSNNDRAIYGKTLGAGGSQDFAGYFEALGAGTMNVAGFFNATGATSNMAIATNSGNVGIGTNVTAVGVGNNVLVITNGTEPAALLANSIKIFSVDSDDATATLGLYLEQSVEAIGTFTASNKIKIKINGALYWVQLDAV